MAKPLQRFFLRFSGEDTYILEQTLPQTRVPFAFLGAFVFAILLVSFGAWVLFLYDFYDLHLQDVGFIKMLFLMLGAGLLTWVFFNIYLLTLYTLSLPLLPFQKSKSSRFLDLSIRYMLLFFFGLVSSIPYGLWIFQDAVAVHLKEWKIEKIKEFEYHANLVLGEEIRKIDEWIANMEANPTERGVVTISSMKGIQERMKADMLEHQQQLKKSISQSNFYFQRVSLLFEKEALFMLLLLVFIFVYLLPGLSKAVISEHIDYYEIKRIVEKTMIEEEYQSFKRRYAFLMRRYSEPPREWVERFEDPPYNTIRKKKKPPVAQKQEALIKRLYHD
jgi:hypothetical protein